VSVHHSVRGTSEQMGHVLDNKSVRRKTPLRLRYLVVFAVFGWAIYHYAFVQYPEWRSLMQTHATLTTQIETLQTEQHMLKNQIADLHSNTYIVGYAAKHFNLILPGQVPFNMAH
jgi:cell division protein FtsB